ncbi:MAG TPA: bis-aminopropyl spermidine synthase family protein [Chloroflexia bacterium]|nr:bis-aminopropyl spermidine synthase family protein [Chloroflexia bacterium]
MKDLTNKPAFLKSIAERVHLREGPEAVESVLRAIFYAQTNPVAEPVDERTLARIARLPMPVVNALRYEFQSSGALDETGPGIRLSGDALKAVQESWGWALLKGDGQGIASAACRACGGTGVAPTGPQWDGVLEALRRHLKKSPITPEAELRRVAFMHESNALAGKDVLVMGDDVLAAAGIALAGKVLSQSGKLARRVVALHPDERILSEVRDIAVREGVIVGLVKHDPRRSIMEDLEGEFDSVFVAPSPVFSSMVNLLSRAIEAARPKSGRIFLACPPLSLDDRLDAQRAILDLGLAIERLVPGFDKYEDGKPPGDLYILNVTEDS